jgi:F0F1-type ATP synthase membrane subunit b/b'
MNFLVLFSQVEANGQAEQIARTFGVDWSHLTAQIISFLIVCALLYRFGYRPTLKMLEEQIIVRSRAAAAQDYARMLAELKREVGRLVVNTTAAVTGKILTPEDQRRLAEQTAKEVAG